MSQSLLNFFHDSPNVFFYEWMMIFSTFFFSNSQDFPMEAIRGVIYQVGGVLSVKKNIGRQLSFSPRKISKPDKKKPRPFN
jgi:hypothetical protein